MSFSATELVVEIHAMLKKILTLSLEKFGTKSLKAKKKSPSGEKAFPASLLKKLFKKRET